MIASLLAQQASETYWRLNRIYLLPEGWHWAAFCLGVIVLGVFIALTYRRDGVELPRGVRWSLVMLRWFAILGLVFFFLDLEKGAERKLTKNSRVLVAVDTSLSMATTDGQGSGQTRRVDEIIAEFEKGEFVERLRQDHDVVVYRFDQEQPVQVASFPKVAADQDTETVDELQQRHLRSLTQTQTIMLIAVCLAGGWLLCVALAWIVSFWQARQGAAGWLIFTSVVLLIAGSVTAAAAHLAHPEFSLKTIAGLEEPRLSSSNSAVGGNADDADEKDGTGEGAEAQEPKVVDWKKAFNPRGVETRLGEALLALVQQERGGPLAGVVVLTDGGQNAGVEVQTAALAAKDASFAVFPIGLGSEKRAANIRLVDIDAPRRAYPKDDFPVTAYVQAYGLSGRTVSVELYAVPRPKDGAEGKVELPIDALVEDARVTIGPDGEVTPVRFQTAQDEQGQWLYAVRVVPPPQDTDAGDNEKMSLVEVIDRKTKVLLIAGGPTREFRFLRNLLHRDDEISSHVWLQTGRPGISQEADELLFEFPTLAEDLFQYDAIVAFDPDWMQLNMPQVELLDRWVAEKAGGLIVVAGPVNTPQWANLSRSGDPRITRIKGLYPVVFYTWRSTTLSLGRFGGDAPWPISFSQDGRDAEFLWLGDDATDSESAWATFDGVFGYYAVKDPKPGARIYSHFSDPDTAIDGDLPIYMAGHYYGAGRVFFQASGEMWRVRAVDDVYFQQYYTKLLRWATEGRLMRDSQHGVLMVDKERCLIGDHLSVTAILQDAQHQPLKEAEVPASLLNPDGTRSELILQLVRDAAREGMYSGQFTAASEGDYRVDLLPPSSTENVVLTRTVTSRVPALETEKPQRNDELLRDIAQKTGGAYFVGVAAATSKSEGGGVANRLHGAGQTSYLPGVPDRNFARLLRGWLMALIAGALCLEWTTRRLGKLA